MSSIATVETEPAQEYRVIRLALIRDPKEPIRETMDEQAFAELVTSIKTVGLIEPIVVEDCNVDFEVIAGHRRRLASIHAGLTEVPCIIRRNSSVSNLAIMIHENAFREDMNPVEEARFYARILTELAENDVDKVCEMVRRDRNHVEGRLLLLLGEPTVLQALEGGKIKIGVAHALNKLKEKSYLPVLLDSAIQQGATIRQVTAWVQEYDGMPSIAEQPADPNNPGMEAAPMVVPTIPQCVVCQSQKHAHLMRMVYIHVTCVDALDAMMQRQGAD